MMPGSPQKRLLPLAEDPRIDRFRALLAQSTLFCGLPPSAIDDLARRMQVRTRLGGARLLSLGDPGDSLLVVVEGRVRAGVSGETGREVTLAVAGPGDVIGEMALLDGAPRSADVWAETDVTLLALGRDAFAEHLRAHPQTALNLLAEMSRRLRRADEKIAELALHDVHHRLVRTLERLAREDGEEVPDGLVLRRRPTQQDLANMIGSCRETISRAFAALSRKGLMVRRGRSLLLTRRLLASAA